MPRPGRSGRTLAGMTSGRFRLEFDETVRACGPLIVRSYRSVGQRSMNAPRALANPRLDNVISWFAASFVVTLGVIYALKRDHDQRKPGPVRMLPRATPAQEPLLLQQARAAERGRGRRAAAPFAIPWRGWKDIFLRTYRETQDDRLVAL